MPRMYLGHAPVVAPAHAPNAVLAQTMHFLVQPLAELTEALQAEIAANPALEIVEEAVQRCPRCGTLVVAGQCPKCTLPPGASPDEPIVFVSPREDHFAPLPWRDEDAPDAEEVALAQQVDLPTYVARQVSPELTDPVARRIAAHLLANLDDDGLLAISLMEAAYTLRIAPADVAAVAAIIQQADPVGVGAPSPREAMLAQARLLAREGRQPVPSAVFQILEDESALALWAREGAAALAKRLRLPREAVEEATAFIVANLNPYPARAAWGDRRLGSPPGPPPTLPPDVVISFHNNDPQAPLVAEVISPLRAPLRVSPLFRQAVRQSVGVTRERLQEQLERASLIVKSIRQRENTMLRLVRLLVREQRAFILHGDARLKPMTRAQMAQRLGVSESTMSRAVAGKLVQLPTGRVIPMASFFDTSLPARAVLRKLVADEKKPQSDAELALRLKAMGFPVARRTVAKYRAMERIPPAYRRRRQEASGC